MKTTHLFIALLASVVLAACESEPGTPLQNAIDTGNASTFDPSNGVIPFPNDLLFQGSTDGTLNIPVDDPADLSDPQVALNGMDGFSTIAPFSAGFASAIDPASVTPASVRVFEVTTTMGAVTGHTAELTFGVDFFASPSSINPADLAIVPLRPLKPKTSYQVVVTNSLMSTRGSPMYSSTTYALAKEPGTNVYYDLVGDTRAAVLPQALTSFSDEDLASLEGLRQLVSTGEATAVANASPALTAADITLSWSFTTQSITDVLSQVRTDVIAATPAALFNPTPVAVPGVAADIYVGALTVPYFLATASSVNDPTPLGSYWKGAGDTNLAWQTANLSPVGTTETIPVLLSTPAGGCGGPCPVIIYQHGITTNRATLLALADSMASAGFAVIGIDLPLHGITGNETDGTEALKDTTNGERTFDLDLVTQDASGNITAQVPDGITDSSGRHFVNLSNLLNSRDNIRQAVSDLFALRYALDAIDFNDVGADGDLDTSDVRFIGHSLGGIIGTTFLAMDTQGGGSMGDAVIAMSGGGIAKLLDGSASFGPTIAAGLAAEGVVKGSSDFEAFLGAAQTAIDSGDPINHTASAATNRGILFYEIVGGGGVPSDLVVPNRVPDGNDTSGTIPGPLSGTDPLVGVDADVSNPGLGLTQIAANLPGPNPKALMRFNAGDHGSLLSPAASLDVTTAMQTDAATFLATGSVVVSNSSVLVAP